MTNYLESFKEWFKERTASPLYGTFIFSVILWNWRFFYILFWQDETILSLPRIEYVQKNILDLQSFWYHILFFVFFPILSTVIIIWILPIFSSYAHSRSTKFYFDRKRIFDVQDKLYKKQETEDLKKVKRETIKQTHVLEEIVSESKKKQNAEAKVAALWEQEYVGFKETLRSKVLSSVNELIYVYNGKNLDVYNRPTVNSNDIAYAHTSGIIGLTRGSSDTYILTEKGKYFIKKYLESRIL